MEEKFTKAEMEIVHKYLSAAYDEFITLYKEVMKQEGFINDHLSVDPWEHHEDYVVLWQNGRKYICPIYPDWACCRSTWEMTANRISLRPASAATCMAAISLSTTCSMVSSTRCITMQVSSACRHSARATRKRMFY